MQLRILIVLVSGIAVSAIQVREPENETEMPMPTMAASALTATEPTDNGMAVGEAPELSPTGTSQISANEFLTPGTTPTVDAVFPPNHRNFSASTYLGAIESPPVLNNYSKYQQQYRDYYTQKNQYIATAKPFKFEDHNNQLGNGLGAFGDDLDKIKQRNKPLPYLFDVLSTEQPVYPIPEHQEIETTEEAATSSPLFSFPFSGLFGGKPKIERPKSIQDQKSEITHKQKTEPWKKIMKVLTTVVPFGLFLATLTPNLLYINTTEEKRPLRLRSLDNYVATELNKTGDNDPLVELVQRLGGLEAMEDPQCEDRFFCEMSVLGQRDDGNFIEKGFWYLANETPDDLAKEAGMKEIFTAIRAKSCDIYNCSPKPKVETKIKKEEIETKPRKFKKVLKSR